MPAPKRSIFQIRLATGVVLMLAAGALLGVHIKHGGYPFPFYSIWRGHLYMYWPDLLIDIFVSLCLLAFVAIAANIWMAAAEGDRYDSKN